MSGFSSRRWSPAPPARLRDAARPVWLVGAALERLVRRDLAGARHALRLVWGGGGHGPSAPVTEAEAAVVADALDAALLAHAPSPALVGSRAEALRGALAGIGREPRWADGSAGADAVVGAGWVDELPPGEVEAALARLGARAPVVLLLSTWPEGRTAALRAPRVRTLRSRDWWRTQGARAGLESLVEVRRLAAGHDCLVLRPSSPGRTATRARPAPRGRGAAIRINDDLSNASSFAWISASIALALARSGARVSIAPTAISTSFGPQRRERLASMIERHGPPADVASEVGWTHFWPEYRRPLAGRLPLPLFAINYELAGGDRTDLDPWMRELASSSTPVAPISSFCRDVLVTVGVAAERTHVVPMGVTDGVEGAEPGQVPAARALKLLHVTNAADLDRNGTPIALAGFRAAYSPGDDATLVVRDYGSYSPELHARIDSLAREGYDARYWPMFFAEDRLGALLGAFDALLAPFRGEGFGVKLLDAMACGTPPICPFFGGPRDFVDEAVAVELDYDLVPVATGYDRAALRLGGEPRWAECRHDALVQTLRSALNDPARLEPLGAAARERARGRFTWRHTAERIIALAGTGDG